MIRFCDGMVCSVDIEDYTNDELSLLIMQNRMYNYIFLMYKKGKLLGYSSYYEIILHKDDLENGICSEYIFFDENVFDKCKNFLKQHRNLYSFMPVFDSDKNIMYMAYEDTTRPVQEQQITVFCKNLSIEPLMDIREMYPGTEMVHLYGLNEISYYLYKYLNKTGIPYKLHGDKWKILGTEKYEYEMNKEPEAPEYASMNIIGEAVNAFPEDVYAREFYKKTPVIDNYIFLYQMINCVYNQAIYNTADFLAEKNISVCMVDVPETLEDLTPQEIYRRDNQINLNQIELLDTPEKIQSLYSVYGEELVEQYKKRETFIDRITAFSQGISSFSMLTEDRKKNIYLMGPCIAYQSDIMAKDTLVNRIQLMAEENYPGEYKVIAVSFPVELFPMFDKVIHSMKIYEDDIFVFMYHNLADNKYDSINLRDLYMTRNGSEWFSNSPIHVNAKGSYAIAKCIYDDFINKNTKALTLGKVAFYPTMLDPSEEEQLNLYFKTYADKVRPGNNGAIVMNCNPYTLGHDYLIRTAAEMVDNLYVFVVEEDKSYFPFRDRFELVKENTEKYKNVIVLPSGKMILSANTFGAYFQKEQYHEIECDATDDMKLFGLAVAPYFGIKTRFSGTEPMDAVTSRYLDAMLNQLPEYGLKVQVIERKEGNNGVISATKVRKLLKEKDWEGIREYVPEITFDYLYNKYNK